MRVKEWLWSLFSVILLVLFCGWMSANTFVAIILMPFRYIFPSFVTGLHSRLGEHQCMYFMKLGMFLSGVKVRITGDKLDRDELAFVSSNHRSYTDTLLLWHLGELNGSVTQQRFFAKESLKYIPIFGVFMILVGSILLKRNWESDKRVMANAFKDILDSNTPVHVYSFLEGSRFSEAKRKESNGYAREKGYTEFRQLLHPRTKGFVSTVSTLRKNIGAVYDVTLVYHPSGIPSIAAMFTGLVPEEQKNIQVHVHRYPASSLPEKDEDLPGWIEKVFEKKDANLERFYAGGGVPLAGSEFQTFKQKNR